MLCRLLCVVVCYCSVAIAKSNYYKDNDANIDIQLSYIDSALINIHWCGATQEDDNTVLVLTSKGSVYRSDDKGRTWIKMSEVFHRKGLSELDDTDKDKVGIVNSFVASPLNKQTIMFTGTESISWISLDCGQTVTAISSNKRQLREFQFHSTNQELVLASCWKKCDSSDEGCFLYKELLLSENGGLSWHPIASYINQFSWGLYNKVDNVPENRIIVSFEPQGKGHQSLTSWNMDANLYYSDDFFQTRTLSVPAGARFLLTSNYLFVARVTSVATKEISLLVANPNTDQGYNYDIIDADERLREHSYTILDTSEGQVFLIVNHLKAQAPIGVIYISDSTGTRYSRSLENAVRLEAGAEFHRVQGLEGIYLANTFAEEQAKLYELSVIEAQENSFGYIQSGFKEEDLQRYKQTRISFDKGGIWSPLKPPQVDCEGKPIKCDPKNCQLHLHLNNAHLQFGPVYTQNNAIGIIVATGSIGKYLSYRPDQVNTYLSRDGGLNWYEIHKGSHIYEMSDHGGLILMVSDQKGSTSLKYSWNEGQNWNLFEFSDSAVEVQNIITEPTNKATRFIVYGTTQFESNGQSIEQGILVTVDLDDLHQRKCNGSDTPDEKESDYETWTPTGLVNPDCLFGKKVTYVRRKRDAQCYNTEKFERIINVQPCECTMEDYECDLGFKRDINTRECLPLNATLVQQAPLECSDFYTISSGFRKIAGDLCEGGVQHQSMRLPCPGTQRSYVDYILIGLLAYALYWLYINQDKVKAFVKPEESKENVQYILLQLNQIPKQYSQKVAKPSANQQAQTFSRVNLEDNEQGLGYREFDEDLLEKDEELPEQIVQKSQPINEKQQELQVQQQYDEDQLI